MHFAARTSFGSEPSAYGEALHVARLRGDLLDLTQSNPTRCGFQLPEGLIAAMANAAALRYAADPLGLPSARQAVAQMYADQHGATIPIDRLLLTASTSESYSFLLRLLCEPGDAILVPSPSYPLFSLLTQLHDVELIEYPLVYHDGWQVDPASLRSAITSRTRALVVIHPNNPTGHYCSAADHDTLYDVAREHDLPLIVDEVFLEYAVEGSFAQSFLAEGSRSRAARNTLTFVLGGLSKLLCLPQMKLGWLAASGPAAIVAEAMARLEVIADTFLSVAAPSQLALPAWLGYREGIHSMVRERLTSNLAALDAALTGTVLSRLRVDAGWNVVLRVPATQGDEELAVHLLRDCGVAFHPGSLYGFPARGWLVASLLPPLEEFSRGVQALLNAL